MVIGIEGFLKPKTTKNPINFAAVTVLGVGYPCLLNVCSIVLF